MTTAPASERQLHAGLLISRVIAGTIFMAHGGQKLLVFGLDNLGSYFAEAGIPLAAVSAVLVTFMELLGGAALIAGALTRLAALGLSITMLGAIGFVHLGNGFFLPEGIEFALTMLGFAATLMFTGAGGWSVDAILARRGVLAGAESGARRKLTASRAA